MELRQSLVSHRKTGGWRAHGATLYLGVGTTRSSSTISALVPSSRQTPAPTRAGHAGGRPRAQRRGTGYGAGDRAQGHTVQGRGTPARDASPAHARPPRSPSPALLRGEGDSLPLLTNVSSMRVATCVPIGMRTYRRRMLWGEGGWCDLHALPLISGSSTIGLRGRLREGQW